MDAQQDAEAGAAKDDAGGPGAGAARDADGDEGAEGAAEAPAPEERRRAYIHSRKPSWLNESHPSFVWGDQQTRKQIREEFHRANDELGGSAGDLLEEGAGAAQEGEEDDDEEEEEDINYGVDPVITDIDEELRVIEGMITEHTKLAEIEVDDDDDEDDEEEDGEAEGDGGDGEGQGRPRKIVSRRAETIRLPPPAKSNIAKALEKAKGGSASHDQQKSASGPSTAVAKGSLAAATAAMQAAAAPGAPPSAPAPLVVTAPVADGEADAKVELTIAQGPAHPKTVLDALDRLAIHGQAPPSSGEDGSGNGAAGGKAESESGGDGTSAAAATATASPQARPAAKSRKKRVRLVELPDYLAMIAREHKQQLLEKQRLELAKAAEAANRAEAESGAVKAPPRAMMIRRGYLDRLGIGGSATSPSQSPGAPSVTKGIDMGINARRAAIASARTRRKPPSIRVQLREAPSSSKSKGFFKKIASWIASDDSQSSADASAGAGASGGLTQISYSLDSASSGGSLSSPALSSVSGSRPRRVGFKETADVYFIPARSEYRPKVRNAIWHTRAEFVEMVMTNMDQVELEMQQEAEAQRRLQDLIDNPPPSYSKSKTAKEKPNAAAAADTATESPGRADESK